MELNLSEDIRENLLIKMRKHCRLRMRLEEIEQNTANFWCYNLKSKTARYTKWKIKQEKLVLDVNVVYSQASHRIGKTSLI